MGSGVAVENRLAAIATVRGGKVVRGDVYPDVDSALQAARLRKGLEVRKSDER
jgi:ketosteroid isomerase-like protein